MLDNGYRLRSLGPEDLDDDGAAGSAPGKRTITAALQRKLGRDGHLGAAPGKRTLTQDLAGGRAVQRAGATTAAARPTRSDPDDPFWFAAIAAEGVAGGGGQLPHLATVQRAFGDHDLSTVRAHVGGDAAIASRALGAVAYATGDDVAFGVAPDLHTVAHEAAHVVQQRGGVQLAGGLGAEGDPYERHADEVADRVVRGESVAHLLAAGPGGGGPTAAIQPRIGALSRDSAPKDIAAFLDRVAPVNQVDRRFLRELINDGVDRTDREAVALLMRHAQQIEDADSGLEDDDGGLEDDDGGLEDDDGSLSSDDHELTVEVIAILGKLLSSGEYVFSNPPLNSSGDIYHTVGFLAILAQADLPLPRIVIGYHPPADRRSPTWVQASRAVQFAAALGFGDRVSMIEVKVGKSAQLNPKAKATREAITAADALAGKPPPTILDQKSSTALIAYLMQKLGRDRVTALIRAELTNYGDDTDEAVQASSDQWIDAQLVKVRAACPDDNRLILFNERIAPNQAQHNSEGPEFEALREAIADMPDVRLYTLRSHDGAAPDGQGAVSSPAFAGAGPAGDQYPDGFNPKVQHLQLLRRIHEEFGERLIGIYGSTSGTLDAAALIGIRTLSLHNFSVDTKDKQGGLNDQDQRELLMGPFKAVVRRNGKDGGKGAVAALRAWMDDAYAGPEFDAADVGGLKPIYSRASVATGKGKGRQFKETASELPAELAKLLSAALDGAVSGIPDALAELDAVGDVAINLARGSASGVGMNCLIHTMVQLDAGGPAAAGPLVETIRTTMIEGGAAAGDEMLDPYEAGAGAALMQQFRVSGGFATQILQWTGGRLLVHPVIGGGPVRLLLHAGNHFEPVWGNLGAALVPSEDAAGGAADGELDEAIQRAIAASLAGRDPRASAKPAEDDDL